MFNYKELCPVPFDQQPLNEYISLKNSCFFSLFVLPVNKYVNTILSISVVVSILFFPLVLTTCSNPVNIFSCFLFDILIVTCVIIILLIRLYMAWSYVLKRLESATVFYEESGWYDGQMWIKTVDSMTKDRLIALYEISPYIYRIQYSLLIAILLLIIESVILYLI